MLIQLKDLVKYVKYGPVLKALRDGHIKYLKVSHFDDQFELSKFENSYVNSEDRSKHLLQDKDILIASKGFRQFGWQYKDVMGPMIASSLFYVVRVKEELVLPEYFVLLMNSMRVQHKMNTIGAGARIPVLPKNELLRIKCTIPNIEEQKKIIEINDNLKKQIRIEKKILEKKIALKNGLVDLLTQNKLLIKKEVL